MTVNIPPISMGPNCPEPLIIGSVFSGKGISISPIAMPVEPIAIESDDVTIDAQGHSVTISGDNLTHIFDIAEAVNNVTLIGLTLVSGQDTNGGALFITA